MYSRFNMVNPVVYSEASLLHNCTHKFINEFEDELIHMSGKCIDIGCGPGDITKNILLPSLNPKAVITGVDISEDMVRYANKVHTDEKRLKFDVLDIQTKNLPEKFISEYDHVFSLHALQWCNDMRQVFKNIYHLLRPGGTMLIIMFVYHDVSDILHKMSQDKRYMSYITHMKNFVLPFSDSAQPQKELKALLKNAGLNVLHCSHRERTFSAEHVQKLPSVISSFVTQYIKNMPHDLIEQFKNEFTQEYMRTRFSHKRLRNQNERTVSDVHEILIAYAQKGDNIQR